MSEAMMLRNTIEPKRYLKESTAMLENYKKDEFGVISQIKITDKTNYDKKYIADRYQKYPEKCQQMAHLRLGFIIGSIGHIPTSILDVGYGSGEFLDVAQKIIPHCFGNDITGILPPTNVKFVEDIFSIGVDVVTFFDVLEHFENPAETIKNLKCRYVVISVPHCHYFSDKWFESWKHRRVDEHLHHFKTSSLIAMMRSCDFLPIIETCIEDIIRKDGSKNILSMVFERI
jgi:hypothetical protein